MSFKIVVQRAARSEFDESFEWYELQTEGLGEQFAERVQEVFDRIVRNPKMHSIVVARVRKAVVRQFPFCIYYYEDGETVQVISVFHTSRDPSHWQRRIPRNGTSG